MYANLSQQFVRLGRFAVSVPSVLYVEFAAGGAEAWVYLIGSSRPVHLDEPGAVAEADRYFGPTAAARMAQVDSAYPRPHLPAREPA